MKRRESGSLLRESDPLLVSLSMGSFLLFNLFVNLQTLERNFTFHGECQCATEKPQLAKRAVMGKGRASKKAVNRIVNCLLRTELDTHIIPYRDRENQGETGIKSELPFEVFWEVQSKIQPTKHFYGSSHSAGTTSPDYEMTRKTERSSKSVEKTFESASESPSLSLPCVVSVNDSAKDNTLYEMDNLLVLCGRRINHKMKRLNHRVYFLRCQDFIKIGCTKDPFQTRISAMQVGNPFKLEGLGVIECDCPGKTKKPKSKNSCSKERDIQSRFKQIKARENSEWYDKKPELLDYIAENALESCSNGRIRYSP